MASPSTIKIDHGTAFGGLAGVPRMEVIGAVGVATLATRADLDTLQSVYGPILKSSPERFEMGDSAQVALTNRAPHLPVMRECAYPAVSKMKWLQKTGVGNRRPSILLGIRVAHNCGTALNGSILCDFTHGPQSVFGGGVRAMNLQQAHGKLTCWSMHFYLTRVWMNLISPTVVVWRDGSGGPSCEPGGRSPSATPNWW